MTQYLTPGILFIIGTVVSIITWSIKQNVKDVKTDIGEVKISVEKLADNNSIAHGVMHEKTNKLNERVAVNETKIQDLKNGG